VSNLVLGWVKRHISCEPLDKWVLAMLADEAEDSGYQSGKRFASVDHLAGVTCMDRKTVMQAITRHEAAGQLLVRRPDDRKRDGEPRGRHNEYVILMGRTPGEAAALLGWSLPSKDVPTSDGLVPGEDQSDLGSPHAAVDEAGNTPATDRAADPVQALDDAQAAPPATLHDQPAEAVDTDVPPSVDWYPTGTNEPRTSPGPVQDQSVQHGPFPCSLDPEKPASRAREGPVDPELEQLAGELSRRGHSAVAWDLRPEQRTQLLAHLSRWPNPAAAIATFASAAEAGARAKGAPRSARGWVALWLALVPPATTVVDLREPCAVHPDCDQRRTDGQCLVCWHEGNDAALDAERAGRR
jgi:hypothetical protein